MELKKFNIGNTLTVDELKESFKNGEITKLYDNTLFVAKVGNEYKKIVGWDFDRKNNCFIVKVK